MNEQESWEKFSENGWKYGEMPNTRELYQAGWSACEKSKEQEIQKLKKELENAVALGRYGC